MHLAWVTDPHLNFVSPRKVAAFIADVAATKPDAVLLGGDVGEADEVTSLLETLADAWAKPIYFVLGNHDFYHGSIAAVRAEVQALAERLPNLTYLSASSPVWLPGGTLLVGTDGWGDGGFGDAARRKVRLNDFVLIEELHASPPGPERLALLEELGRESAEHLRAGLSKELAHAERAICLTHVPPFREATWHQGKISSDDFLPWFSCRATGEVLRETASANPNRQILVLCGHTHGAGEAQLLPNLRVLTGGAEYGSPRVQRTIDALGW